MWELAEPGGRIVPNADLPVIKHEEWTAEKIEALEAEADQAPEAAAAKPLYRTTVVLRRFGEARLAGDAAVELLIRFKDGSTETRSWDGRERWTRFEIVGPVEAASAEIDPRGVWLIDENTANNSRSTDGLRRNVVEVMTRLVFWVQNVLHFFGSWS
jgi:hypothetical protein